MAGNIDEILFEVEEGLIGVVEPRLYESAPRVAATAHPFSGDELRAFVTSGEHPGFE